MRLAKLIEGLGLVLAHGTGSEPIEDLTDDSRAVCPGALFVARGGTQTDGRAYIDAALDAGAVAVLTDRPIDRAPLTRDGRPVAWLVAETVDQKLAGALAERFFDHPQRKLTLLAVTGTNGKTTTAFMIQHLLHQAGVPCGMIGTVRIDDGATVANAQLTTPGAIELSRLLAAMVANGCQAAVIEASSHALAQHRTAALDFKVAVFTNLTGDHLDYHRTMADYLDAKALLFESLSPDAWAILNADDDHAGQLAARCAARHKLWCTLGDADHGEITCRATDIELATDSSRARFDGPWGSVTAKLPLIGRHNLANILQAVAAVAAVADLAGGLPAALARCPQVPGRLEAVRLDDESPGPSVVVDYAHTHDALENVLEALRPLTKGRLRVMFGCGGDRDRTKRPKMAEVACRLADDVVITSDNPRTEDPRAIIDDIVAGVPQEVMYPDGSSDTTCFLCPDRAAAIAGIIADADDDDLVLLAGKGHEDYQIIGTRKRPFDDRQHAAEALAARCWWAGRKSGWTPRRVQTATGGHWLNAPADLETPLTWVRTDSRALRNGEIFVALKGERFDAHDFLQAAVDAGASLLVVHRADSVERLSFAGPAPAVLLVDDTLTALQDLARAHRRALAEAGTKVIAVTGSNGKTTTRHLIHQVLSARGRGTQSVRSFNNHIGVPLTLLAASPADDFTVVEVGSNHEGEIAALADIIRPDVAALTNIGTAHIGLFGSKQAIAAEKGALLRFVQPEGWAVLPADEPLLADASSNLPPGVRAVRFSADGRQRSAEVRCTRVHPVHLSRPLAFRVDVEGTPLEVALPLLGAHYVTNALVAIAVGNCLAVPAAAAATALANAGGVAMRMQVIELGSDDRPLTVILDAYNANPDSVRCALQTLATAAVDHADPARPGRRVAILGDMFELGDAGPDAHRAVGATLNEHATKIDLAVLIGKLSAFTGEALEQCWHPDRVRAWREWDDDLPEQVAALLKPGDLVLLKASRGMALERLIPAMMKTQDQWLPPDP